MPEFVPMPKLGFDMAEGRLVRKVVQEGQPIKKGEILAEVETDKATVEVEAYTTGTVVIWLVDENQFVPIGTNMVVIAAPGEQVDVDSIKSQIPKSQNPKAELQTSNLKSQASNIQTPIANLQSPISSFLRISPIARRMSDELKIDPRLITGTGPEGRITKKDVEAFAKSGAAVAASAPSPAAPAVAVTAEDRIVPLTKLRQAIARRMVESKTSIPHFYVTTEVDMGAVIDLRKQLNGLVSEAEKISVNDFVLKAAALTLRDYPYLNASFNGNSVIQRGHINMGIAVAVNGGLLTVVVKDCDVKSVKIIATEAKAMAARARDGKVKPEDVEGSTFTVSNLGMFEVDSFTAIINPPEAAILAVGAAKEVAVVKDGSLTTGWRMKATVSADHRVTDGAEAAQFMQAFKKKLEEPLRLLI
ncbi:MAG: 2-oxo acid dehydrogenase subunit E2 [Chloroflexi bacterium]|nr:2-oxo acid dehydrogenase subunit E2 [Chloroflexota bacterium]